jgi:glycosyltransferase involved in cell wall biosynthesis
MQRHSLLLISELAKYDDLEIFVIHPHADVQVFKDLEQVREVVIPVDFTSGYYLQKCYQYSKEVFRHVSEHPDAIIYSQGLSVWYRAKDLGNRLIVNPHGLEPYQTLSLRDKIMGTPFRMIFNGIFRSARHVVALGGKLTQILSHICGPEKVVVLPNAVNQLPRVNKTHADSKTRFLFVGRFAFNKGIDVLINAVHELNNDGKADDLEFFLVGKGPLYDHYMNSYSYPNLHYMGFADDDQLNELYTRCDAFILPTLFEGMPTVVLEAMMHDMAVIVTDVGATREMVDEQNGFIIEKNDVSSLKKAILDYCSLSVEQKRQLGTHSYNKVSAQFTWKMVAEKHYGLFRSLKQEIS